ncbi:unnamed protein product [Prorocentrum cordatum]|uniref:Uncharacterized protein n=1 Tax=Prorocentrum cordatum TaxID=2364126 RepID=A0ABN9QT53_9DINO|nr:unnamed protein product [Polarella glacialis]
MRHIPDFSRVAADFLLDRRWAPLAAPLSPILARQEGRFSAYVRNPRAPPRMKSHSYAAIRSSNVRRKAPEHQPTAPASSLLQRVLGRQAAARAERAAGARGGAALEDAGSLMQTVVETKGLDIEEQKRRLHKHHSFSAARADLSDRRRATPAAPPAPPLARFAQRRGGASAADP